MPKQLLIEKQAREKQALHDMINVYAEHVYFENCIPRVKRPKHNNTMFHAFVNAVKAS